MLYSGTDPESYIAEYTLVYEDETQPLLQEALTNPPGHLWRDKWTALSGPLSIWG